MPVQTRPVRAAHQARRRSQTQGLTEPIDRPTRTLGSKVEPERGSAGPQDADAFRDTFTEPADDEPPDAPADHTALLPRLYTVREAASFFGRSDRTLRTWVQRGHLHPVRIGRSVFFTEPELLRVIHGGSEAPDGSDKPGDQYLNGSMTSADFGKTAHPQHDLFVDRRFPEFPQPSAHPKPGESDR